MKGFIVSILFLACSALLFGQGSRLIGIVTDSETGEPLYGATVRWRGGGTTTNTKGVFSVDRMKQHDTLIISYVGYRSRELHPGERDSLRIVLVPEENS